MQALGDFAEVRNGYAFKSSTFVKEGSDVVRISNIKNGIVNLDGTAKVSAETSDRKQKFELEADDLLIAMSGATTGKVGRLPSYLKNKVYLNQRVGRFVIKDKLQLDSNYLKYVLTSENYQGKIWSIASGVAQPNISAKQLMSFQIPLPPLPEQKRIAAILDQADALRRQRQASLDRLNTLGQSIFYDMFGRELANQNENRLKLNEIFEFTNGANFSKNQKGSEGILMIDVRNMYSDDIFPNYDSLYRVKEAKLEKKKLKKGDVLFVRSSLKEEGVGWPALFDGYSEDVAFCGFIIRGRPLENSTQIESRYLLHYLRLSEIRKKMINSAGKVAITNINQQRLGEISVPIPSIKKQASFNQKIIELEKLIKRSKIQINSCKTLFGSLQQRAFRGEL